MPAMEEACRHQKALLWASTTYDNYGKPNRAASYTVLDVRWEKEEGNTLDSQGNLIEFDAKVVVNVDIAVGSTMWEGDEDDLPGTASIPESDVMEVVGFIKTPDIKGRNFRRVALLKRSSDAMPTSA